MNVSQLRDPRFWPRWKRSGAIGTFYGPVSSTRIGYLIQQIPIEVLAMEDLSWQKLWQHTDYWQIEFLYRVMSTEKACKLLRLGLRLRIRLFLSEINMGDFRRAGDSLSRSHPELKLGEMWLTNVDNEESFRDISFPSKRLGYVAYDYQHAPVDGFSPVFVNRKEYEAKAKVH